MQSSFNLINIIQLLKKNWRFCLSFTMISSLVAAIIVFLMTPQYKSSTTVLAGNPQLSDKARLFNQQIKDLNTNFGTGDDLDRIYAFAELNSTLEQVILKNNLVGGYYQSTDSTVTSVLEDLRKDLHFVKTEKDQLIISCQLSNKILAAKIVNDIVAFSEKAIRLIIQENYQLIIIRLDSTSNQLKEAYAEINKKSVSNNQASIQIKAAELNNIIHQLQQTQQASQEFRIALKTMPDFIQVMEKGVPSNEISWPNKPLIITIATLLGFAFSAIVILSKHQIKQF